MLFTMLQSREPMNVAFNKEEINAFDTYRRTFQSPSVQDDHDFYSAR